MSTEKNLFYDAKFIYNKISKRHKNISIVARSLGTGIATYITKNSQVSKLILVTPYDSIVNMAKDKYPFYPIHLILKDQYNSVQRVKDIKIPTLILLASEDKTIPAKYSNNLIKAFNNKDLKIITIKDSGHGSIIKKKEYYKEMNLFFKY